MSAEVPTGWYIDPDASDRQRYFDDSGWSPWVSTSQGMVLAPLAAANTPGPSGVAVTREILRQARADGVINARTLDALLRYAQRWSTRPSQPPASARPASTSSQRWGPSAALSDRQTQPVETVPRTAPPVAQTAPRVTFPSELTPRNHVTRWWRETRETVKSDLAIHGLAYLGVLLLFAGVFGLVVWSFSDINPAMRPVAELAIPSALFIGAAMLNRRGTRVVAAALELAGGLLLPIVTVASFVDNAPVPPDPSGVALTVVLATTTFTIALAYALWVRPHPTSALAYLVAPVAWLGAGLLSLSWLDPVPQGESVAQPRALEIAVMSVAAGATLLAARLRPQLPFAKATSTSGPVALVVLALLALLAGSADGWPAAASVVTAAGIVVGIEALEQRLPGSTLTVATSVTVGLGLLAARSGLDTSPWVTASAFAAATGWAEYHRRKATAGERRSFAGAAALFPGGVVMGAVAAIGWPAGLLVTALLLAAYAVVVRVRTTTDTFWSQWVACASGALAAVLALATTVTVLWPATADSSDLNGSWQASVATLLVALALGAARTRYPALVTWAVVVVLAQAWVFAVLSLNDSGDLVAVGWGLGAAAAVCVVVTLAACWSTRASAPVLGHVTLASLALGAFAVLVAADAPPSSARLAVVSGAAAVAWACVSVVDELKGTDAIRVAHALIDLSEDAIRSVTAAVALTAAAGSLAFTVDARKVITDDAWWAVVAGAIALGYIAFVRWAVDALPSNSRVATEAALLLAAAALVLGIVRADTGAQFAPTVIAFGLVITVAGLVRRRWRDSRPAWLGWGASAALTVIVIDRMGAGEDDWPMTLMVWGSVTALAALAIERLRITEPLRRLMQRTLPPAALGTVGLVIGALTVAVTEDLTTTGQWFLLVAATAFVAGILVRDGRLFGIAVAAITVSYSAVAPWSAIDHPWTIVVLGALWMAAADVVRRWPTARYVPALPSSLFVVGQLVIVVALLLGVEKEQRPLGLALAGLAFIAVAIRNPVAPARPWYGAFGVVLVLAGAADEGPGWLAGAWSALSVGATAAAAVGRSRASTPLRLLGAASAAAAWATFMLWAQWTAETSVIITAIGVGVLLALLGVAAQLAPSCKAWAEAWGSVGLLVVLISTLGLGLPEVPRAPAGQMVGAGLALAAVGAALAAEPLRRTWLRILTVLLTAATAGAILFGIDAAAREVTAVAVTLAAATTLGIAVTAATNGGAPWRPALLVGAPLAGGVAIASAASVLPDRTLLVGALVLVAAQCIVIGRVLGSTPLLVAGPPLLSLSWMLYASEALSGSPQWYMVPVGLALIVMGALLRWTRRQEGKDITTVDVVALELAGVGLITGAALIQTATDSLGYALLAMIEGVLVTLWGAVTKVRRRLAAGVGVVIVSVVMLIAVPLLPVLPEWRGAVLWVAVAGLGLAAIVVATFIERGRAKVEVWVTSLSETLNDWE
ncbi:MAG: hypothetical protein LH645_11070 [Actinomycetia bacterium]|nr:hypothetical protein [Actinomycetes bacterium]